MFPEPKTLTTAAVLVVLWTGEGWIPYYAHFRGDPRSRLRHDGKNFAMGLANGALLVFLFAAALALLEDWAEAHEFGLLRLVAWSDWLETVAVFIAFDCWMYLWHRANHENPWLWRFHRMHHSDAQMDATTGLRFHPGEVILSALARGLVLPLLGMTLGQLAVYEAVFLPVVLFHHSNVALPRWLDHGLLGLIVTPAMHRVHHSRWRPETDSNFGSVFPYWDLLLGTFRLRQDAHTVDLGLAELDGEPWQTLAGLLRTPLARIARPPRDHGSGPTHNP